MLLGLLPAPAAAAAHPGTLITIDGRRAGPVFDGIGAISGGGGNSRYLIDYPARQRAEILSYLFGPGGADLQILKLEIGGDANSSDGAEPSVEHSPGTIDCASGYEWWLAEQAVARDPAVKLYGLQWAAPGWVGSIWSHADAHYVIEWLNCAKSHGLAISYLGGWNEHGYNIGWYEYLRRTLNASGYRSVKIVAADAFPSGKPYAPAKAWQVASAAATDPAFNAALAIIGAHDTCGYPTTGYRCESTATARLLGKPLWESELGAMDANTGAPDMARAINNGYTQAGITGYIEWPLIDSMPPGLPYENRGLVTAGQPRSGSYTVNRIAWAIAQTTQFVKPGWRHVYGANAGIGNSGTYDAYEAPNGRDWSLVAENTGHFAGQRVGAQTIDVKLTGGLATGTVHVWATNLWSSKPATWFVRRADIHPAGGAFSYSIRPGYVVSFTSTGGQSRYRTTPPSPAPMTLPYQATRDPSNEAWGLASQEGAFIYRRCFDVAGRCVEQLAGQVPVWWTQPVGDTPTPYAIVGDPGWRNYTVSTKIMFTNSSGRASLIGRFGSQGSDRSLFTGYELSVHANGTWQITRDSNVIRPVVIAHGKVAALKPGRWHPIGFALNGRTLTASIDGRQVGRAVNGRWKSGLAGIGSSWDLVQFDGLTVS